MHSTTSVHPQGDSPSRLTCKTPMLTVPSAADPCFIWESHASSPPASTCRASTSTRTASWRSTPRSPRRGSARTAPTRRARTSSVTSLALPQPHSATSSASGTFSRPTQNRRLYCMPCIVRQISCEYAGAPDVIYREHPLDHIPPDARWRDPATDNVVHLCTHVAALAEADDIDLELDFTELLNCGDQLTREQSFDMHRRWARQCLAILRTHPTAARFLGR